jgi:hypothetical protein
MKKTAVTDHTAQGDAILQRLAATTVPAPMKAPLAAFKKAHSAWTSAAGAADKAKQSRDASLAAVGAADDALDAAVETLAAKMAGAQMGTRSNPFAGFSALAPNKVVDLAYARETAEVQKLCAKVQKAKPAADVAKAAAACVKLAAGVTSAIGKLTAPQLAYTRALGARDALLLPWTKALGLLKRSAQVAWFDDPAQYKAVFSPPDRLAQPAPRKRAKKAPAATPPAAPPAPAPPAATGTSGH